MIEIKNLSKTYNQGLSNEVRSLNEVDLNIQKGEFLVILGANGSGKSTLLNCIAGSVLPGRGSILFDGTDISRLAEHKRSKWIARVFQNPLSGTAPDLTILENFRLASLRTRPKGLSIGINERFRRSVGDRISELGMGLENRLDQLMGTLSGGQRQALTLLMCVMDSLSVLLLDEPTAALDPRSADLVMRTADRLIKQYQLTALMVTHNIKDSLQYGSRIIQMEEGRILRDLSGEDKLTLKNNEVYGWFD